MIIERGALGPDAAVLAHVASWVEAFFIHVLSGKRWRMLRAVSLSAEPSLVLLYFETPAQYSASAAMSGDSSLVSALAPERN